MYILKKGRAGIQYNAGKTEALSLETMIRTRLMAEMMGRMKGTPFPRALSTQITIISVRQTHFFMLRSGNLI